MLRIGKVSELQMETGRVRVVFDAEDQLVSWWLPVMQPKTLHDQVYWMPDLEEHVVCLLDEHAEFGVVMGAIYSEADAPPVASLAKLHVRMKDGSTFEYDRDQHRLEITVVGGDVVVNVDAAKHVHIGGEVGQELATKKFVQQQFNTHVHLSASPGAPTSPPQVQSPLVPGSDITKKQLSE